jgi:superfamily II DNA/RNA helicase
MYARSWAEREERVQCTLLANEPDGARHNFNCVTMSNFEIKTHRSGRTYRAERKEIVQWTILVKEPADALSKILKTH